MIKWLKGKMSDFKRKKDPLKQERIKICFMYLIFGFVWIYFSDRIVNRLVYNPSVRMVIHTYKGMVYVLFTASVLYYLISNLLRKVEQADQKLRVSEEKYKAVINQMQFGMALYEGASGEDLFKYRLVDSNHSYEILTGLKKEEIIGKYFFPNT